MWFLPFWKSKNIEEIGPINLGAVFRETNEARLGAVVHNYQGQILASLSKKVRLPPSRDIVEALAAAKLSSLLMTMDFLLLCLKGILKLLSKLWEVKISLLLPLFIYFLSLNLLKIPSVLSLFSHIRRTYNAIVHNLAKHERHVSDFSMWMKDVPSHFHSVLLTD